MKKVEDISIFQGIVEFKSFSGEVFRCEKDADSNVYKIFTQLSNGDFKFERIVSLTGTKGLPRTLLSAIEKSRAAE